LKIVTSVSLALAGVVNDWHQLLFGFFSGLAKFRLKAFVIGS
jgi:hypothetical protein